MGRTYQELLEAARQSVPEVDPHEAAPVGREPIFVDVREPDEWADGVIADAVRIPRGTLEYTVTKSVPDLTADVIVYCAVGHRSLLAARTLQDLGYTNVSSLRGGFTAWRQAARELATRSWSHPGTAVSVQPPSGPSGRGRGRAETPPRRSGDAGRRRWARFPAALYLAAAGVGTLGLIDNDVVDASNLQRQVIHDRDRLGTLKVESARQTIAALNPDVKVEPYATRLDASSALELLSGYDVIIDGADNLPTRYLVNDAALHLRTPVVHGSVLRHEGQASVFTPYEGPCYRCLFPLPPPPELAPSCAEAGVLGALPGVIGSIQAMETLKLLLGIGDSLAGRLLTYDALEQTFRTLRLERDPNCRACASPETLPVLVDYDESCTPA